MKNLLYSITFLLVAFTSSCGNVKTQDHQKKELYDYIKVGTLNGNGQAELDFTITKSEVIKNWEKSINMLNNESILIGDIYIQYNDDMGIYNELIKDPALSHVSLEEYQVYSIIAESKDGLYKTAYKVEKIANELYVRCNGELLTLTCSGCAIACKALMIEHNNICYPNCTNENESCTKNETLRISTGNLNIFGTDYKRM